MTEAEAMDMAARAAGWRNWRDAEYFWQTASTETDSICVHAKTLMENAALKAENKRLTAILAELNDTDIVARTMVDNAALEAKLAVAREALDRVFMEDRRIVDHWRQSMATGDSHLDTKIVLGRYAEIARAALKEIEGD